VPSKNPEGRLLDIVENATAIASYIKGLDGKTLREDRMRRDAVERCLQRSSEAAVKLGNDAERLIPSQPWKQIRSLENVLRHGYDVVSAGEIWIMASGQAPRLAEDCQSAIDALRQNAPE
jgi:uncharacterized protein with HEPN domain